MSHHKAYLTMKSTFAIASCTHYHDQPSACTALPSWRCSITSARLAVRDIEVRRNSGLSGKARFTLHALHAPLVRCACSFIEATHIEHYRNTYAEKTVGLALVIVNLNWSISWLLSLSLSSLLTACRRSFQCWTIHQYNVPGCTQTHLLLEMDE